LPIGDIVGPDAYRGLCNFFFLHFTTTIRRHPCLDDPVSAFVARRDACPHSAAHVEFIEGLPTRDVKVFWTT
jgi:hypothetical protein